MDVAIEATIKGLHIGPFAAHLAREKPQTIEDLYSKFEKYYRSNNDLHRRLEEQNQNRQFQGNGRNAQRGNRGQSQQQPHQGPDQQVFNIEHLGAANRGNGHRRTIKTLGLRSSMMAKGTFKGGTGTRTRIRGSEGNIVSFMKKTKGTSPGIAQMLRKHRKD